jgi:hypothetical protein
MRANLPILCGIALAFLIGAERLVGATSGAYTYTINGGAATITAYDGVWGAVSIPSSFNGVPVTGFGTSFRYTGITSITIPNTVTKIEDTAFMGCTYLTSVSIPNSVTSIGMSAFYACQYLTDLTIPNSVTTIGPMAFQTCMRLESIRIPDSVTTIKTSTFSNCVKLTSVSMGNMVTSIETGAFQYCSNLTSITLSASLTNIDSGAFSSCSNLTSITIPPGVVNIGDNTFSFCSKLSKVVFKGNAPSKGSGTFRESFPTVYYLAGSTGWGEAYAGRPTVQLNQPTAQFSAFSGSGNGQLAWTAVQGFVYEIQSTDNLSAPFVYRATRTATSAGEGWTDPEIVLPRQRFYRVFMVLP